MRVLAILIVAVVCVSATNYDAMFTNFKAKYNRNYATPEEEAKRFAIFIENMKTAKKLMMQNPYAVFGANEFADMSAEEFKSRHNAERFYESAKKTNPIPPTMFTKEQVSATGQSIDWRTKGAVTGVKDQGQCGSCWAFSTTGNIEGQWQIAGNALTSVSEQELVSCDTIDEGCNGGLMDNAFKWLQQAHNGTIVTEESYPYVSGTGRVPACSMSGKKDGATISGYKDLPHDETQMATFVYASGPLAIGVDATSFQTYSGGILTNCISSRMDHGVLIVGFDDNNVPPYWIIKNSWGSSWGEEGYIRVKKGSNECLITEYPTTSIVKGGPSPTTTTAPPGPGTHFEQLHCKDPKCGDCETVTLPQAQCIAAESNSYIAQCITDGLLITTFSTRDCSGESTMTLNPTDVCSIVFFADSTEEFILNKCGSGPGPTTGPPGPTFTQMQCTDYKCTESCENYSFPLDVCLKMEDKNSVIANCSEEGLLLKEFTTSEDCTGPFIADLRPLHMCLEGDDGQFFEDFCSTQARRITQPRRLDNPRSMKIRRK